MPATDPETDLALLIRAAEIAGDTASRYSGPDARKWDKPDGAGPVTEADLAVNAALADLLPAARPDYGWLSEETEDNTDRLSHERLFIIDPIDGTRSFAEGSRTWAHALAVADRGRITAAVIYLPQRELMYTAAVGEGAKCNGTAITISPRVDLETQRSWQPARCRILFTGWTAMSPLSAAATDLRWRIAWRGLPMRALTGC